MKLFALFMSFYLLLLPLLPCGDTDDCREETQLPASHDQHEEDDETCTPFCYCTCCPASMFTTPVTMDWSLALEMPAVQIDYIHPLYSFHYHSFWQPPKLS